MKPWMMIAMFAALAACVETATPDPTTQPMVDPMMEPEPVRDESTCIAYELEEDSIITAGVGAAEGPPSWGELPPTALVASTYLRIQDNEDAATTFAELNPAITETLLANPGMMGVSIRISPRCNTARTLTVWASEEAMMEFVMSDAHVAAMAATPKISRGGSITSTWQMSGIEEMGWDAVIPGFVDHDGPVY